MLYWKTYAINVTTEINSNSDSVSVKINTKLTTGQPNERSSRLDITLSFNSLGEEHLMSLMSMIVTSILQFKYSSDFLSCNPEQPPHEKLFNVN